MIDPLQSEDMKYLIQTIWRSVSALSEDDSMSGLCLSRWNTDDVLSHANCVLLTKDEAKAHATIKDKEAVYGSVFVNKVQHRLLLAKAHFALSQ